VPDRHSQGFASALRGSGRVSLRVRLILAATVAVAVAVVFVAAGAYVLTRHELYSQVDSSLRTDAGSIQFTQRGRTQLGFAYQLIDPSGQVMVGGELPVTDTDRAVADGTRTSAYYDTTVDGTHLRVYAVGLVNGGAAQVAVQLSAVDHTLKALAVLLFLLGLGGVAVASLLAMLVARAALMPVDRLTADAERVAKTMDLSQSIEVEGADEIARLGQALNTLLATVDQSQTAQRRLVADASHELRTPLTSMRTNLELLARSHQEMSEEERSTILADLVAQAAELSQLVNQLVDLEREPLGTEPLGDVAFDEVVGAALTRARLHSPSLEFVSHLEPTVVVGHAGVLERAAANLLDNAAKWSPPGGEIEVNLVGGTLSVRDHGPGIDPADVPHVFERFYRSARARALPGSGLGLSIVRQAAEDHGGQAWLLPAPGGGTIACLRIPTRPASAPPLAAVAPGPRPDAAFAPPSPAPDEAGPTGRAAGEDGSPSPPPSVVGAGLRPAGAEVAPAPATVTPLAPDAGPGPSSGPPAGATPEPYPPAAAG
jgi:two-component system, OmpR family, sensor histidine kinase MprB